MLSRKRKYRLRSYWLQKMRATRLRKGVNNNQRAVDNNIRQCT